MGSKESSKKYYKKVKKRREKAEELWAEKVKERAGHVCQRCGERNDQMHAHHIVPRSRSRAVKFDLKNGICLCRGCHHWWHQSASELEAISWFRQYFGDDRADYLIEHTDDDFSSSLSTYDEIIEELEEANFSDD